MVDLRRGVRVAGAALAAAVLAGCGATPAERPMTASLFLPPAGVTAAAAGGDARQAGAVIDPDNGSPKKAMVLPSTPAAGFDAVRPLSPLGPTTDPAVAVDPSAAPADAAPAAGPPPTGVYMTVGGVLAQVNETPIYAHTVLALLDRELAARARDLDPDQFRQFAAEKIAGQLRELIGDELDFAAAFKTLSEDDKKLAKAAAGMRWEQHVKQAGGSPELARRQAAQDGYDFDELMKTEYRRGVVDLYREREIFPQVQVSAQDMREFYAANAAKLYADKDRLEFRVIAIDPARLSGDAREAGRAKAEAIRARAVAGQDFAALASAENDDEGLKATGGDPGGWMDRGSFRVDAVEAALWPLAPGAVAPVVESEGLFYVAKLTDKHVGRTKPFDDPAVQDDVSKRLTQQQLSKLLDRVRDSAMADAVVFAPEDRLNTALEMVMQKYVRWTAR